MLLSFWNDVIVKVCSPSHNQVHCNKGINFDKYVRTWMSSTCPLFHYGLHPKSHRKKRVKQGHSHPDDFLWYRFRLTGYRPSGNPLICLTYDSFFMQIPCVSRLFELAIEWDREFVSGSLLAGFQHWHSTFPKYIEHPSPVALQWIGVIKGKICLISFISSWLLLFWSL